LSISLIITSYNWPAALEACLESVEKQSRLPAEVLIADDGSSSDTRKLITQWGSRLPLIHCWVPDIANRPAVVRNRAALKARSRSLVFIDGDCVLSPTFLAWHMNLAAVGTIVAGGRVLLDAEETRAYLTERLVPRRVTKSFKFKELNVGAVRDVFNNSVATVRTCNMGIGFDEFVRCGGFDESYIGWAREDTDFVLRAVRGGLQIRNGRCGCNMFHLYHGGDKGRVSPNDDRLASLVADTRRVDPVKSLFRLT
jgi:glycosyltransferase involved in cell wall biosynthesis